MAPPFPEKVVSQAVAEAWEPTLKVMLESTAPETVTWSSSTITTWSEPESLVQEMVYTPGVPGFVTMPPARVTVPEQLVLVAVMVLEVEPKAERQADEPGALGAPVTVKPTGKVTVRVPDSAADRAKTKEKLTPVWPALSRERLSVPAVVLPLILKMSRSEEHTSELQSQSNLVCRLL